MAAVSSNKRIWWLRIKPAHNLEVFLSTELLGLRHILRMSGINSSFEVVGLPRCLQSLSCCVIQVELSFSSRPTPWHFPVGCIDKINFSFMMASCPGPEVATQPQIHTLPLGWCFHVYSVRSSWIIQSSLYLSSRHFPSSAVKCHGALRQIWDVQQSVFWRAASSSTMPCSGHPACSMYLQAFSCYSRVFLYLFEDSAFGVILEGRGNHV